MKKILLLGDSIRMDYDEFVRQGLTGQAQVIYPEENGRFAQYTLQSLGTWKGELQLDNVDIIHWNNGLWDLLHTDLGPGGSPADSPNEFGVPPQYDPEPLTPADLYAYMLGRIHRRLIQLFPHVRIAFATTTPVLEEQADWAYRSNAEIGRYNQIAREVLAPLGVVINDLGAFSDRECARLHRDWVHYNSAGSQLQAAQIIQFLTKEML